MTDMFQWDGSDRSPGLRVTSWPGRALLFIIAGSATLLAAPTAWAEGTTLDIIGDMEVVIDGEQSDRVMLAGTVAGDAGESAFIEQTKMPTGPSLWQLNITGYDPEGENLLTENTIAISASLGTGRSEPTDASRLSRLEMIWIKENGMRPEVAYVTEGHDHEDAEVTVEHFEFDGETGAIRGTVTGTACRLSMRNLMDGVDSDDCVSLEARFDTQLALEVLDIDG